MQQFECHSCTSELTEWIDRIGTFRIDESNDFFWDDRRDSMVIRHDDIDAEGFRMPDRSDISSSTVDRDDEFHLFLCQFIDEVFLEAVSIVDTVWESIGDDASDLSEKPYEDGGTRYPIDIIVTENNDSLMFLSGFKDSLYCFLHVGQEKRIMKICK